MTAGPVPYWEPFNAGRSGSRRLSDVKRRRAGHPAERRIHSARDRRLRYFRASDPSLYRWTGGEGPRFSCCLLVVHHHDDGPGADEPRRLCVPAPRES